ARMAPLPLTALTFTAGALLLSPALLWTEAPLRQLALGWPWLLYLGGVATAGAHAIYALGLRRVAASGAGIASLTEPLTATRRGGRENATARSESSRNVASTSAT